MYNVTVIEPCEQEYIAATLSPPTIATTRIALIGGFAPRRCGIATFTADIHSALGIASNAIAIDIYAMKPAGARFQFDAAVTSTITENSLNSFVAAAAKINRSGADIVWLQHEFGLFGGPAGDLILELLERVAAPLIVTLHTVLPEPDADQLRVIQELVARAAKLIVMSEGAGRLLHTVYGADADQVVVIPHGVPDRPFGRTQEFKRKFGFDDRQVMMTFGLLSSGKGIETVIEALPAIVEKTPGTLYCIVGATHPNLLAREGEAYRERLQAQAKALGVADHILWRDAFLESDELLDLIEAADIYVTAYPGAAQATSGTLSYAVALGKAVISTPFAHALELLGDEHGILVPFNDSDAIAREVASLLDEPDRRLALQQRAYARGRDMLWSSFAAQSLRVIESVKIRRNLRHIHGPVGIEGLLRICDGTGILQHSIFTVPDRSHGYCVDDNARALMLMNRWGCETEPDRSRLASTFAAFVESAWNPESGEFRNFMGFDRKWLENAGSHDSCDRTIWALGATALEGNSAGMRRWARGLFDRTAQSAFGLTSPRATAFAMLGADYLLATETGHGLADRILNDGAMRLQALLDVHRRPVWLWFEPVLAYDNCRLSEAMIRAGLRSNRSDWTNSGLETLCWLFDIQIAPDGHFRPIGSESFGHAYQPPKPFDQQPVEIWAAIDAAAAAFDATGDPIWLTHAARAFEWFAGANDRGIAVACRASGSCHDGINPRGLNLNEGAESLLSFQLANCAIRDLLSLPE
ncbi:glycosyltransferase family 4 protein [Sphingorhabdus pulchriflava]|uniref:glycosyltransferase family 4 protein n=1 Tax=Sphingorhabdus pulchriflava TaxID=2292257 RepID=UPI001EF051A3|nr:glycosyltransferase family 4 protein [Sphingorhabdus pulchriflava]